MRSRQGYRTVVLGFLNVVPYELFSQPNGLPCSQSRVLAYRCVTDGELFATLLARHSRHDYRIRPAPFVLAQAFSRSI